MGNRVDVLDYSWGRPPHDTIRAYGATGCMRYLFNNGKGLTASEVAQFRASGLSLGLNYEAGAGDLRGYGIGQAHARQAEQLAQGLGLGGNVIIFSADWDVRSSEYASVGDAIQGAKDVKGDGKVGIYGHANLIDYCWNRFGDAVYFWQTYAWSGGRLSSHADLYQWRNGQKLGGADVDFNQITGRTFWALGQHTTEGGQAAPITEQDWFDMATKQDLIDALHEVLESDGIINGTDWTLTPKTNAAGQTIYPAGATVKQYIVDGVHEVLVSDGVIGAADAAKQVAASLSADGGNAEQVARDLTASLNSPQVKALADALTKLSA